MNLAYPFEKRIHFEGRRYRLNLAFDNVLRVFDVQREWLFSPAQRLELSVELLAGRRAARLPVKKLAELFERTINEFINPEAKRGKPSGPHILDFTQDAPLIYAAFMQAYRLDLTKQRGRLDWRFFIALFQGLPEDTKIREVMSIRQRPIPEPNKNNAAQISALMEAKAFYAIKLSEDEAEHEFQAGVDRLAETLINRAKAGV